MGKGRRQTVIINNLFPTPVGFFKFEQGLTKKQFNFLNNQKQRPNIGNTSSEDTYILKQKSLLNLTVFIEESLNEYIIATYNPKNNIHFRITQSWLNWTKPGQHHHKHSHPNSVISGCFYINANKETDKIFFYKEEYKAIKITPNEWNPYNSESWWYSVGTNDLIFFPSNLVHTVEPVGGEETRISLAFNAYPTGHLGEEYDLTALYIGK